MNRRFPGAMLGDHPVARFVEQVDPVRDKPAFARPRTFEPPR